MERKVINPWQYQNVYGYVQANELQGVQRWLLCAGQAPVDAEGRLVPGDMDAQLNRSLENLETILRQADFTLADVVRMTYYTTDIDAGMAALEAAGPGPGGEGVPLRVRDGRGGAAGLSRAADRARGHRSEVAGHTGRIARKRGARDDEDGRRASVHGHGAQRRLARCTAKWPPVRTRPGRVAGTTDQDEGASTRPVHPAQLGTW